MKLAKIDLSNVVAVGHEDDRLGLLIDRGDEVEYLELNAPPAAYQGLKQVSSLATNPGAQLTGSPEPAQLPATETPIAMLPVCSSMAKAVGYDRQREVLQVEFNNGSVYQYSQVETETWEYLQQSDSVGQFFNREIKGYYESQRLDTPEAIAVDSCEVEDDDWDHWEDYNYCDDDQCE